MPPRTGLGIILFGYCSTNMSRLTALENAAAKSCLGGTNGVESDLQGWLVMAFVCAERMARAGGGGQA
jgi:hypothetical protein